MDSLINHFQDVIYNFKKSNFPFFLWVKMFIILGSVDICHSYLIIKCLLDNRINRSSEISTKHRKASVFHKFPFTIILKYEIKEASPRPLRIKIDPGSKKTGIAIVSEQISDSKGENTRYRKPRFLNRTRPKGWLPPSLESRISNIETRVKRLMRLSPIQDVSQELVKFDTQLMENPEI